MTMPPKWLALAATLLDEAAKHYSNHGCSDWDFPVDWTAEEHRAFVQAAYEDNGDPENFDPQNLNVQDWEAMQFLAKQIRAMVPVGPTPDEYPGPKFVIGREGSDYYAATYVEWLEERVEAAQGAPDRLADLSRPRPRDQWHEDDGPVLWWWLPVEEPPYVGTPLDSRWPEDEPTCWTPLVLPDESSVAAKTEGRTDG